MRCTNCRCRAVILDGFELHTDNTDTKADYAAYAGTAVLLSRLERGTKLRVRYGACPECGKIEMYLTEDARERLKKDPYYYGYREEETP